MAFTERKPTGLPIIGGLELEDRWPTLPPEFVEKFPELEVYNRQIEEAWDILKTSLTRLEERVIVEEKLSADLEARVSALETRVTALETYHP